MGPENNLYSGIVSLAIILGAAIVAHIIKKFLAYRELKKYRVEKGFKNG